MLRTYLRLRTWLGWGWHPDDLRVRAQTYVRTAFQLLPASLIAILVLVGVVALLEQSSRGRVALPNLLRLAAVLGACSVILIVVGLLVPALSARILAQRAQTERPAVIYGHCVASIPDYFGPLYACIGPSPERARWYVLPLAWDPFIEPSN